MAGQNNVFIEAVHVSRAQTRAEKVAKGNAEPELVQWTDKSQKGLTLRLRGHKLTWVLKTQSTSYVIGVAYPKDDAAELTAPAKARDLAGKVKTLVAEGADKERVNAYLAAFYVHKDHGKAMASLLSKAKTWTLAECVNAFVAGRTGENAADPIKPSYEKEIRVTFARPEFDDIRDKPVVSLKKGDFERIRDNVDKRYGTSPGIKVVSHSRAVLGYCATFYDGDSGLGEIDPWWVMFKSPKKLKAKERTPTIEEIAKTIVLAEHYLDRPMPGRKIETAGASASTVAGLWWLCFTCQRSGAGLSLHAYDVADDPQREGWKLAMWQKDVMKAGSNFVLPIPPAAWAMVSRYVDLVKARHPKRTNWQEWAFPSEDDPEKHVTNFGVSQLLGRLAGKKKAERSEKPKDKAKPTSEGGRGPYKKAERTEYVDLFKEYGIEWWTPHDLRRSITAFLDEKGIPGGATVVLAHEIDSKETLKATESEKLREDFLRQRQARITRLAYGASQHLWLKAEALEPWTEALLAEYEKQKAEMQLPEMRDAA